MTRYFVLLMACLGLVLTGAKGGCGGPGEPGGVCDYNGKTHQVGDTFASTDGCNSCSCSEGGNVSCTEKACAPAQCGGIQGLVCPKEQVCVFTAGQCNTSDSKGTCQPKGACTQQYDPVCGCDGKTYGNACTANQAGARIDHKGECKSSGGATTCKYDGKEYKEGDSFPATDGCNQCSCEKNGSVSCTEKACVGASCKYDGKEYKDGESFPASDGCNTCTCKDGNVGCTKKACIGKSCKYDGKEYKDGESFPATDGCNTCTCKDGNVGCTKKACTGKSCKYDGKEYKDGESFPATDGCNKCFCQDGNVSCTEKACVGASCKYDGKEYKDGESFPASDGCNTCICKDGNVGCTKKACVGKSCEYNGKKYKDGESFPSSDGCNRCICKDGNVGCTKKACAQVCGGNGGLKPCPKGQFCNRPKHCGFADGTGFCKVIPKGCTKQYAPVCGCNGKTYGNECMAHAAGTSVQSKGKCPGSGGGQCGGKKGLKCAKGEVCILPAGKCGVVDNLGTCKPGGQACTQQYAPVCGCNGKTYGNACSANQAGAQIDYKGECKKGGCSYNGKTYKEGESFPSTDGCNKCSCMGGHVLCTQRACVQSCGSRGLKPCPSGTYCKQPNHCGATDIPGSCQIKPKVCNKIYKPVCGCDGKTYGNECSAAAAGVSVKSQGACSTKPRACGSRGLKPCPSGTYCKQPSHCGATDIPGTCEKKPVGCNRLYKPVCGCDGKTYSNACNAAAAGVSVKSQGTCKPKSQMCGGIAGFLCPRGQICVYPAGQCTTADASGTCQPKGACTQQYAPVCGCDGKTYGNACTANQAGARINYKGACIKSGCKSNNDCKPGYICDTLSGKCDGCICPAVYQPVCGVDGKTYGNSCNAGCMRMKVACNGKCPCAP